MRKLNDFARILSGLYYYLDGLGVSLIKPSEDTITVGTRVKFFSEKKLRIVLSGRSGVLESR